MFTSAQSLPPSPLLTMASSAQKRLAAPEGQASVPVKFATAAASRHLARAVRRAESLS